MEFVPTGSTLLNLAISGKIDGGWPVGRVSNLVGDRSTGKTLIAVESSINFLLNTPKNVERRVLYVETESAFDIERARELGLPKKGFEVIKCPTIEELYELVTDLVSTLKKKEYVFLIIDSLDALASKEEQAKKITEGSYRTGKQKMLGKFFQDFVAKMEETNITPLFISQIRENLNAGAFGKKHRRSGGKALDFYCSAVQWLYEGSKIKDDKTKLAIGTTCIAKNEKNKVSLPYRQVEFDIIYTYGIDDTKSMIEFSSKPEVPAEYRIIRRHTGGIYEWGSYVTKEQKCKINNLIQIIEDDDKLLNELRQAVQVWWDAREQTVSTKRKKYKK